MRLDQRLSESALIRQQFGEHGILQKCLECPVFNRCKTPQYNAPGLTRFICMKRKKRKEL